MEGILETPFLFLRLAPLPLLKKERAIETDEASGDKE